MADLIQTGMDWLGDQLRANVAQTVTYSRGPRSVSLSATLGSTAFRIGDPLGGTRIERTDRDFLIAVADLILGGLTVLPERGDEVRVTRADGATVDVYEVLAPGGEPVFRWSDSHRTTIRIHTKHVGTEEA